MLEVGGLARKFPGWNLTELRRMTVRERRYWWKAVVEAEDDGRVVEFNDPRK